ncbi:MAG TPA: hypothetical protein VMA35_00560 [Candidatus Sulfopaludibacter sp.]|nr:hypothetical protein [Candidatus Sulfopaludibacter sp.]
MMTGSQILRNRVSAGATARLDRGFVAPESVEVNLQHWLHQIVGKIGFAISRRIPVGFEDETGFHLGVQPGDEDRCRDRARAGIFAEDESF